MRKFALGGKPASGRKMAFADQQSDPVGNLLVKPPWFHGANMLAHALSQIGLTIF
jgi:hypothetical protein